MQAYLYAFSLGALWQLARRPFFPSWRPVLWAVLAGLVSLSLTHSRTLSSVVAAFSVALVLDRRLTPAELAALLAGVLLAFVSGFDAPYLIAFGPLAVVGVVALLFSSPQRNRLGLISSEALSAGILVVGSGLLALYLNDAAFALFSWAVVAGVGTVAKFPIAGKAPKAPPRPLPRRTLSRARKRTR